VSGKVKHCEGKASLLRKKLNLPRNGASREEANFALYNKHYLI